VRAAFVGRLAVGHRPADGDLVGQLSGLLQALVKVAAGDLGLDRGHLAAILDRRQWLGVPRFLMRHAAGHEDVDQRLCLAFLLAGLLSLCRLETEQVGEGEAESGRDPDVQETAPRWPPEVGRIIIPGPGYFAFHGQGFSLQQESNILNG